MSEVIMAPRFFESGTTLTTPDFIYAGFELNALPDHISGQIRRTLEDLSIPMVGEGFNLAAAGEYDEVMNTRAEGLARKLSSLGSLGSPEWRARVVEGSQAYHTAIHEVAHILVGASVGLDVVGVSVVPEGNTLGATYFNGASPNEKFQVTAAASMVDLGLTNVSGTGGDRSQIEIIDYINGRSPGSSISKAISQAKEILNKFDPDFIKKLASMIACLKNASKGEIKTLMNRAAFEVALENENPELSKAAYRILDSDKRDVFEGNKSIEDLPDKYIVITTGGDSFTVEVHGDIKYEQKFCLLCGEMGHSLSNCSQNNEEIKYSLNGCNGETLDTGRFLWEDPDKMPVGNFEWTVTEMPPVDFFGGEGWDQADDLEEGLTVIGVRDPVRR